MQTQQKNSAAETATLLERLAAGPDESAWALLLEHHGQEIYRVAYRILRDEALAEDVCQETLLQLRDHAAQFRGSGENANRAARNWIMRIACNTALCLVRKNKRADRLQAQLRAESQAVTAAASPVAPEVLGALREELAQLPDLLRQAITLHFYAGLEAHEIAQELRCPVGTVKARVHRGLEQMRQRLKFLGIILALPALEELISQQASAEVLHLPEVAKWRGLLRTAAKSKFSPPRKGLSTMAKLSLAGSVLSVLAGLALVVPHLRSAETPAASGTAGIQADSERNGRPGLVDFIDAKRSLDNMVIDISDGKRSIRLYGRGRAAWGHERRASRYFKLDEQALLPFLKQLAATKAAVEPGGTPKYSVRFEAGEVKQVLAAPEDADAASEIPALVNAVFQIADKAPNASVGSIKEGLEQVREGAIPSDFLTVDFMHHKAFSQVPKVGDAAPGFSLSMTGRSATDQTAIVSKLKPIVSMLKKEVRADIPEFENKIHVLDLSEQEFQAVIDLLLNNEVWDSSDKPKNIKLGLQIMDKNVAELFSFSSRDQKNLGPEPARWKKVREGLEQLHLRVFKEGTDG